VEPDTALHFDIVVFASFDVEADSLVNPFGEGNARERYMDTLTAELYNILRSKIDCVSLLPVYWSGLMPRLP
jgi:hypothetical protein